MLYSFGTIKQSSTQVFGACDRGKLLPLAPKHTTDRLSPTHAIKNENYEYEKSKISNFGFFDRWISTKVGELVFSGKSKYPTHFH